MASYSKQTLLLLFLLLSQINMAQSNDDMGYIILNDGTKEKIHIEKNKWLNNPESIRAKTDTDSQTRSYALKDIKEFKTNEGTIYKRATVLIDVSSNRPGELSLLREPDFEERTVFLKTLVDGKSSLFQYYGVGAVKYFYNVDQNDIKQLIYKRYNVRGKVLENNDYKQKLSNEFKCDGFQQAAFDRLNYSQKSLENIFNNYNYCSSNSSEYFQQSRLDIDKEKAFRVRAKAGFRLNSFNLDNEGITADFESKITLQIGLESEYAFKASAYSWSVLFEGMYFSYSENQRVNTQEDTFVTYNLEYNAIELSLGTRYAIPIGNQSRVFANVMLTTPIHLIDALGSSGVDNETTFNNSRFFSFGGGIELSRIAFELRLQTGRDILPNLDSKYNSTSFSIGYKF